MRHVVIGVAGHVDHGKTALVKALTGIDTDSLPEEKRRGLTIELGFAHLDLPNGGRAGIIDAPGHERFIKNMLAGAGGVDIALLTVAADDGVMPQTREHLLVLDALGVKAGIVALTKADLADEGLIALVAEDIRGALRGTFLAHADILPVSARTGQGIPALKAALTALAERVPEKSAQGPFRLPIDRVFTMEGFGTVVTGTLIEGGVACADEVMLYPGGAFARVRGVQVHGVAVDAAMAGQRAAVNLTGIKKEDIRRGDILAAPGSMLAALRFDAHVDLPSSCPRAIENGARLRFHHGSRELLCRVTLIGRDRLAPGEAGFMQLSFLEPYAAKDGDRFILRFLSPAETAGGGVLLDCNAKKHRRMDEGVGIAFEARLSGGAGERLLGIIADNAPMPIASLKSACALDEAVFQAELSSLVAQKRVFTPGGETALDAAYLKRISEKAVAVLEGYHKHNPLLPGMRQKEACARLLPGVKPAPAMAVIALLAEDGVLALDGEYASLPGFSPAATGADRRILHGLEANCLASGFTPKGRQEALSAFPNDKKRASMALNALIATGVLIHCGEYLFHRDTVTKAERSARALMAEKGAFTLGEFRDAILTTRKYALALLEYFDDKGVTKKVGDVRVPAGK